MAVEALERVRYEAFDLILLDVLLPGMEGFEFCRQARPQVSRRRYSLSPRWMTNRRKVEGLDAGADDDIVKPFQVAELLARVRALLRRGSIVSATILRVGDLSLDPATRLARRGERSISLSATEYALLEYLMRNAGQVLTRSLILEHVWQYDFAGNDNVLDVYIRYLRNKIDKGESSPLLHTVRGVGFELSNREPAL
ncbi:MAG: response regulator transcription factor [Armatimonas sp.]